MRRIRTRTLAGLAGAVAVALLVASPAAAHVTVNPREAEQGSFAKLTFRMPTERDIASSVQLEVIFPERQPLSSVSVKPQLGWTYRVDKVKLPKSIDVEGRQITETVSKITWTAQPGFAVKPGEFAEFEVSAGRLPADKQMVFKAIQTYDNGEVVRWIEQAAPGSTARPERPAPVLSLGAQTGPGAAGRRASRLAGRSWFGPGHGCPHCLDRGVATRCRRTGGGSQSAPPLELRSTGRPSPASPPEFPSPAPMSIPGLAHVGQLPSAPIRVGPENRGYVDRRERGVPGPRRRGA